jgi:hypothetical protein
MSTKLRMALCVLALVAPAWVAPCAAQPDGARTTGKVLVLDNERTLEGDIERVGEQYRVRRPVGELWIRAENTLRLCETREEAYSFLRARANLRDPDEHLRLARWCHLQGLRPQALEEATAAVELRPNDAESRRLLRSLQRATAATSSVQPGKPPEEGDLTPSPQPPALSTDSLSGFVSRVQPILMNACASCHATGRGGAFKLLRTYETGLGSRKSTQQNLAAVLAEVNTERPSASPLLTKAVSVHGKPGEMGQSPLKNREVAAYRSLEEWVRVTLEKNPQLHEKTGAPVTLSSAATSEASVRRQPATDKPVNPEEPVDPFDPVVFNRQMHPKPPFSRGSQNRAGPEAPADAANRR